MANANHAFAIIGNLLRSMVRRCWVLLCRFYALRAIPSPKMFALKVRRQTPKLQR